MKKWFMILAGCALFILCAAGVCYCGNIDIQALVDDFSKATDLQRDKMLQDYLGKEISAGGVVSNAGEYDFFDIVNDFKGTYYQVTTAQQKTKNNQLYQVILLFKDKDKAKDLDRGQKIQKDGRIMRIEDERLQIAVWLFCGEPTESDKTLFKANPQ